LFITSGGALLASNLFRCYFIKETMAMMKTDEDYNDNTEYNPSLLVTGVFAGVGGLLILSLFNLLCSIVM
jgi:hypothetical protein